MAFVYLNMEQYKRKAHFDYFNSLAYPYVGVTVEVDITHLMEIRRRERWPFFFTLCYCVSEAANAVPEFRRRIRENRVIEYDLCPTSHTVVLEDETYCYCTLRSDMPFREYLDYARREQGLAKQRRSIDEEEEEAEELLFVSSLPWLSYTALVQPVPVPADSNPRITWGKYFIREGRTVLPVTVLCHHALVDGIHLAAFYRALEEKMDALCRQAEDRPEV